jgi:hypothetical protein
VLLRAARNHHPFDSNAPDNMLNLVAKWYERPGVNWDVGHYRGRSI